MAQVVLIGAGAHRPGLNAVGDLVAVHDDDVYLDPIAYANMQIVSVSGFTAAEIRAVCDPLRAPREPDEQNPGQVNWWDAAAGQWKRIVKRPKYGLSLAGITQGNLNKLAGTSATHETKVAILQTAFKDKVALDPANDVPV